MKLCLILVLAVAVSRAEEIKLADGKTVQGTITRFTPATLHVSENGKPREIKLSELAGPWRLAKLATSWEVKQEADKVSLAESLTAMVNASDKLKTAGNETQATSGELTGAYQRQVEALKKVIALREEENAELKESRRELANAARDLQASNGAVIKEQKALIADLEAKVKLLEKLQKLSTTGAR